MTSRQPGTTAPGTRGRRATPGQAWALVVPLTLLILLGLAGLRGVVSAPHWNGPLRHDGVVIGLVLEVILGILLVITVRRRAAAVNAAQTQGAPLNDVAAKLRGVLILVLGAGMVAVAVGIVVGLHLRAFAGRPSHPAVQRHQGEAEAAAGRRDRQLRHPAVRHPVRPAHRGARGRGGAQHLVVPAVPAAGQGPARRLHRRGPRGPARGGGIGPVGAAHHRRRAGGHHCLLRGDGDQPGRAGRGPRRRGHARRAAGPGDHERPGAGDRGRAADRTVLRGPVLQPSAGPRAARRGRAGPRRARRGVGAGGTAGPDPAGRGPNHR